MRSEVARRTLLAAAFVVLLSPAVRVQQPEGTGLEKADLAKQLSNPIACGQ